MAKVSVEGDQLVVEVLGLDQLWALRRRISAPLAHVRGATPDPGAAFERPGLKLGGARIPRVITAGTFRQDGERVFWDVRDHRKAVVIELRDEEYARLIVQVDDPRATAKLVAAAASR